MNLLRLVLLLAIMGGLAERASADPAIEARFQLSYDLTVSYEHYQSFEGGAAKTHKKITFPVIGQIPKVTFVGSEDGTRMSQGASAPIVMTGQAEAFTELDNPKGTSDTCSGGSFRAAGAAAAEPYANGRTFFAAYTGVRATGDCTDSNGKTSRLDLRVAAISPPGPDPATLPALATDITPSYDELQIETWARSFDVQAAGAKCPEADANTTSCVLKVSGTVSAKLLGRNTVKQGPAVKPPKLDGNRVRTRVRCSKKCTAQVTVGAVELKNDVPRLRTYAGSRTTARLRAGATRDLTTTVPPAGRSAVSQGLGFARISVRTKGRTTSKDYPLGLPRQRRMAATGADPVCDSPRVVARPAQPATVAFTCSDPDGDPLTIASYGPPEHGTFTQTGPDTFVYTSERDFRGVETVAVTVRDEHGGYLFATGLVKVDDPAPTCARPPELAVRPLRRGTVTLTCTDPDGGPARPLVITRRLTFADAQLDGNRITVRPTMAGAGELRLSVEDDEGSIGTATVAVRSDAYPVPRSQAARCYDGCRLGDDGAVALGFRCGPPGRRATCEAKVQLRAGEKVLGSLRRRSKAESLNLLIVRLSAGGRRYLAAHPAAKVSVRATVRGTDGRVRRG